MQTRSAATTDERPLDRLVRADWQRERQCRGRVPWPRTRAPLRIKTPCPICGAALLLDAGQGCEQTADGTWIATELDLQCTSEPDIDSGEWDEWHRWHYRQPYTDWLPLEQRILRAVRRRFYFEP
ncbi:MAG: hypothetical protein KGL39_28455 [Patescibacteria group bacterium]|nr:hypothetical protein [Patescibacteria group bacterium]